MPRARLEQVPETIWQRLESRDGAWRTPVLATASVRGGDARIVVLRAASTADRTLVFFTDRRSRKCAQIGTAAGVCLLVFDAETRMQVRLYGDAARVDEEGSLRTWWENLDDFQKAHYAAGVTAASADGNEKGRVNFAAFRVCVTRFHCLWLHDTGNEAAEFSWRDGGWTGRTVRP